MAERVVADGPLHQHGEFAEQFVIATGVVLAVSLLVLVPGATLRRGSAVAVAVGGVIVAGLALRVGHAGGANWCTFTGPPLHTSPPQVVPRQPRPLRASLTVTMTTDLTGNDLPTHRERHRTEHIGWLRAAVLGANDGIVSTASLVVGVAAATASRQDVMVAGVAGLVAGALSMAAGEYVSVSSQADTEGADLERERRELATAPAFEEDELADIYVRRGLAPELARTVAQQLMAHDALGAHARDELGLSAELSARPLQAALISAATFAVGAALPLAVAAVAPTPRLPHFVSAASLVALALLGGLAARTGGASATVGAARVAFWGAIAMGVTALVGAWFGAVV